MAKFMLLLGGVGAHGPIVDMPYEKIMQAYGAWTNELIAKNAFLSTHKLFVGEGKRLVPAEGDRVKDGPFTETKETVGGYYVIEAKDYDEAVKLAAGCPTVALQGGYCDVRRIEL